MTLRASMSTASGSAPVSVSPVPSLSFPTTFTSASVRSTTSPSASVGLTISPSVFPSGSPSASVSRSYSPINSVAPTFLTLSASPSPTLTATSRIQPSFLYPDSLCKQKNPCGQCLDSLSPTTLSSCPFVTAFLSAENPNKVLITSTASLQPLFPVIVGGDCSGIFSQSTLQQLGFGARCVLQQGDCSIQVFLGSLSSLKVGQKLIFQPHLFFSSSPTVFVEYALLLKENTSNDSLSGPIAQIKLTQTSKIVEGTSLYENKFVFDGSYSTRISLTPLTFLWLANGETIVQPLETSQQMILSDRFVGKVQMIISDSFGVTSLASVQIDGFQSEFSGPFIRGPSLILWPEQQDLFLSVELDALAIYMNISLIEEFQWVISDDQMIYESVLIGTSNEIKGKSSSIRIISPFHSLSFSVTVSMVILSADSLTFSYSSAFSKTKVIVSKAPTSCLFIESGFANTDPTSVVEITAFFESTTAAMELEWSCMPANQCQKKLSPSSLCPPIFLPTNSSVSVSVGPFDVGEFIIIASVGGLVSSSLVTSSRLDVPKDENMQPPSFQIYQCASFVSQQMVLGSTCLFASKTWKVSPLGMNSHPLLSLQNSDTLVIPAFALSPNVPYIIELQCGPSFKSQAQISLLEGPSFGSVEVKNPENRCNAVSQIHLWDWLSPNNLTLSYRVFWQPPNVSNGVSAISLQYRATLSNYFDLILPFEGPDGFINLQIVVSDQISSSFVNLKVSIPLKMNMMNSLPSISPLLQQFLEDGNLDQVFPLIYCSLQEPSVSGQVISAESMDAIFSTLDTLTSGSLCPDGTSFAFVLSQLLNLSSQGFLSHPMSQILSKVLQSTENFISNCNLATDQVPAFIELMSDYLQLCDGKPAPSFRNTVAALVGARTQGIGYCFRDSVPAIETQNIVVSTIAFHPRTLPYRLSTRNGSFVLPDVSFLNSPCISVDATVFLKSPFGNDQRLLSTVNSLVLKERQTDTEITKNFSRPVSIKIHLLETYHPPTTISNPRMVCTYWDPIKALWKTNGLILESSTETSALCQSDHLTDFSVLLYGTQQVSETFYILTVFALFFMFCFVVLALVILWNSKKAREIFLGLSWPRRRRPSEIEKIRMEYRMSAFP